MFDFPSSPTVDQIYTSGGASYRWNGYAWILESTAGVLNDGDKGDIIVSNTGATWMFDPTVVTAVAKTVLDDTTVGAMRITLGVEPTIALGTTAQYWRGDKQWTTLPTGQPLDATLTALAGLDATPGLVEQTGTDVFAKRALGVAAGTSVPTRADADARYAALLHTHTVSQLTDFAEGTQDVIGAAITGTNGITATYNDTSGFTTIDGILLAPLASPTFTGDPKAPTPLTADNDTSIATTAYVKAQGYVTAAHIHPQSDITNLVSDLALKAPLASPVFTGNPTAPTPTAGDNDTTVATTAFVTGAVAVSITATTDNPPGTPYQGQLWFETDSGKLFIYFNDGTSSQWVQVNGTGTA